MHLNQLEALADSVPVSLATEVESGSVPGSESGPSNGHTNLLDILIVLARRKMTLLTIMGSFAGGMFLVSMIVPGYYSSTTTILPPKQASGGLASMLKAQAGGLADLGEDLGLIRENQTLFIALLQSNRVTDALVGRFDLQRVYRVKKRQKAVEELAQQTDIAPKQGLITILVRDTSRDRAAAIANGYVEELYKLNQDLAITEAAQRRVFFQTQLESAKTDLLQAELALKKTQESTKLIEVDSQGKTIIEGIARLKAEVTADEVELRGMLLSATDENPAVMRQREKLAALRAQLGDMENAGSISGGQPRPDGIQIPTNQIPEAEFEYIRALREVKYREALFEMIAKQLEAARLDEAKSAPLIQVVDRAAPSQKSLWPGRMLLAVVGALIGFFMALAWVAAAEFVERLQQLPEQNARLETLWDCLKRRKPRAVAMRARFE